MPKLRKTLPKDFQDLINAKDDEAIKAALLKCEVGAYHGYSKDTTLFYPGLSRDRRPRQSSPGYCKCNILK